MCGMENKLQEHTDWWVFVQSQLDRRGWSGADFQRTSGIHRSRLNSWKDGATPTVEMARAVARAFGMPVKTVFIAAGFLTPEELGTPASAPVDLKEITDQALLRELERRLLATFRVPRPPTREEVAADPDRYEAFDLSLDKKRASRRAGNEETSGQ